MLLHHRFLLLPHRAVAALEQWFLRRPVRFVAVGVVLSVAWTSAILLLGTGPRQRFPHPRLTRALAAKRIGVEAMDLQAACRTYNILMAEERRVAAALLFR